MYSLSAECVLYLHVYTVCVQLCVYSFVCFSSTSIADDSREEKKLRSKVTEADDSTSEEGEESVSQLRESFIAEREQKVSTSHSQSVQIMYCYCHMQPAWN